MRWTKLKSILESLFASSVADQLAIHATGYGNSSWGRSWLTWNGTEIANFSDNEAYQRRGRRMYFEPCLIPHAERISGRLVEAGEFSSMEFKDSCFRFKDMQIEAAYNSQEPLLIALSTVHRKLGHRRVVQLTSHDHPLIRNLAKLRLEADSRVEDGVWSTQDARLTPEN